MRVLAALIAAAVAVWVLMRSTATGGDTSFAFNSPGEAPAAVPAGKFSLADIERLWTQYGGDPSKAPLAAAVALAESGGDPYAYNPADPHGGSFGLFQINGVHGSAATFDIPSNIKAAIDLSNNGLNWNPWGAFTNGSYEQFYAEGQ